MNWRLSLVILGTIVVSGCAASDGDALGGLQCGEDQVPRWNGTEWVCSGSDVLGQLTCSTGAVTKWDGSAWVCGMDESLAVTASHPLAIDGNNNISLANGGVTTEHIANQTIVNEDIDPTAAIAPGKVAGTAATLTGDQVFEGNSLVVDSVNTRVGVGVASPTTALDVGGDVSTSGDYRFSAPQTRTLHRSPAAFRTAYPESASYDPVQIASSGNYAYISTGTSSYSNYLLADLSLPDGAILESMTCYFYDNSSTVDITSDAYIYRRALTATSGTQMLAIPLETVSENTSTVRQASGTLTPSVVVDNSANVYFLRVYWYTGTNASSLARFYGCSVDYTIDRL